MAKNKTTLIYNTWIKTFDKLSNEQVGIIVKALIRFSNDETPPPKEITDDFALDILFTQLSDIVTIENEKYEKKCAKNKATAIMRENKKKIEQNDDDYIDF